MTYLLKVHFDELSLLVKMINRLRGRLSLLKYDMRGIDDNSYGIIRRESKKVKKLLSQCEKRYNELTDTIIDINNEITNSPQSLH